MPIEYRAAHRDDVPSIARLLQSYMLETYETRWHGTEAALHRDAFGVHLDLTVALADGTIIGFAAWRPTYDLHHCVSGLEVIDMYIAPSMRGRGAGPGLLAVVAAHGALRGAAYMTGSAVERGSARRLYDRATIAHGPQSYLSGRAFRALGDLAGASPRQLLTQLPRREWNLEP